MTTVEALAAAFRQRSRTSRALRSLRRAHLWLQFKPGLALQDRRRRQSAADDWDQELRQASELAGCDWYESDLELRNDLEPQYGKNVLGFPSGGAIERGREEVGWWFGNAVGVAGESIPVFQTSTDLEVNLPAVFERHRPGIVIHLGTANGASAVLFHQLSSRHHDHPQVVTVDVNDVFRGPHGEAHERAGTAEYIRFVVGSTLDDHVIGLVSSILAPSDQPPVLVSLDDDHDATHVSREIETYAGMLRPEDVILVQDTWDQGLRGQAFTPLLSVLRSLRQRFDLELDEPLLRNLVLPCNFVHGVLVKTQPSPRDV